MLIKCHGQRYLLVEYLTNSDERQPVQRLNVFTERKEFLLISDPYRTLGDRHQKLSPKPSLYRKGDKFVELVPNAGNREMDREKLETSCLLTGQ